MELNSRHRKTVAAIYATPTRRNLKLATVHALMLALGADIRPATGDHTYYTIGGISLSIDRPRRGSELPAYAVESVRELLERIGVTP